MYQPQPILGRILTIVVPSASIATFQELTPALAGITDDRFVREFESRSFVALKGAADVEVGFDDPTLPTFQPVVLGSGVWHRFYYTGPVYIRSAGDVEVIVGY